MQIGLPTWVIVATGLLMNVIAALMTNFVIDGLGEKAAVVEETQSSNNQLIQLTWQQVDALERRRETLLIILTTQQEGRELPKMLVSQLLSSFSDMTETALNMGNINKIMLGIDQQQDLLRNKIDTLYLDNLQLTDSYREIVSSISNYRNLALFLQILGLALIMARDLSRKPN
ncbi:MULTISPECIES: hypothetical protein [Grimontia]|uniref:DNA mismatch repair protein n=1 Tax=Grimontia marina TaxID=646534 RepID=A0A128FHT8_9GAMM|nr:MULTISPECIES: hypothetical protein [Grimontia]WRW00702.1 hypothetical protein VP504_19840 [Grimontia sp. NTOU-MAR1]CZF86363.1 hypothetical protein GMA8713_04397 [Grimontia marina]